MSRGMIQLVSVVARASRIGLMCAGVAVTVAVNQYLEPAAATTAEL